jgi:hypothetical protein
MRGSRTCFQRAVAPARRLPELLWHCGTNALKRQRLGGHCQTLPSWRPEGAQPAGTAHAGGEGFGCRAVSHCLQESGLGTQIQGSGTLVAAQQQKKVVHTRLIKSAAVTWQMGSKLRAHVQFAQRRSPCASSRPCDIGRNALELSLQESDALGGVFGAQGGKVGGKWTLQKMGPLLGTISTTIDSFRPSGCGVANVEPNVRFGTKHGNNSQVVLCSNGSLADGVRTNPLAHSWLGRAPARPRPAQAFELRRPVNGEMSCP